MSVWLWVKVTNSNGKGLFIWCRGRYWRKMCCRLKDKQVGGLVDVFGLWSTGWSKGRRGSFREAFSWPCNWCGFTSDMQWILNITGVYMILLLWSIFKNLNSVILLIDFFINIFRWQRSKVFQTWLIRKLAITKEEFFYLIHTNIWNHMENIENHDEWLIMTEGLYYNPKIKKC